MIEPDEPQRCANIWGFPEKARLGEDITVHRKVWQAFFRALQDASQNHGFN